MQRILLPLVCAALIAGGVYFLGAKDKEAAKPAGELMNGYSTEPIQPNGATGQSDPTNTGSEIGGTLTNDNQKIMSATIKTNKGDIRIEFSKDTPNTVANFVKLAKQGFYDGTKFHRVIAGFMNQGGDPLTKDDTMKARWGTGGPGYQFADEITPNNRNVAGTISMANAGPNTNGSQFFINVADNGFSLDTKHTVFGKVTKGLDVVMAINKVETDEMDRPLSPVTILSISLE
jgi:peptidylprolyl isomerase